MNINEIETYNNNNILLKIEFEYEHEMKSIVEYFNKNIDNSEKNKIYIDISIYELFNLIKNIKEDNIKNELLTIYNKHKQKIIINNKNIDITLKPLIYAIVNITPDSFYDGNISNLNLINIMNKIKQNIIDGANIIEIGGKSSKPTFNDISVNEEWNRLKGPIKAIKKKYPNIILAVDTNEYEVMKKSLENGADIINDIDGFNTTEKLKLISQYQPTIVAMYNGRLSNNEYNLRQDIKLFFEKKKKEFAQYNINKNKIIFDTGVGFRKRNTENKAIEKINIIKEIEYPTMIAISRKSFMTDILGVKKENRLYSTLILEYMMIEKGGRIIRTHDVKATKILIDGYLKYKGVF